MFAATSIAIYHLPDAAACLDRALGANPTSTATERARLHEARAVRHSVNAEQTLGLSWHGGPFAPSLLNGAVGL